MLPQDVNIGGEADGDGEGKNEEEDVSYRNISASMLSGSQSRGRRL